MNITGNSQCPNRWKPIANNDTLSMLEGLDNDITINKVWLALWKMKKYKVLG